MKKITLMFVLLSILMGGAYAQKVEKNASVPATKMSHGPILGTNTSYSDAGGAIAGAVTLSFLGVGEFVNHEWIGGSIFLLLGVGGTFPLWVVSIMYEDKDKKLSKKLKDGALGIFFSSFITQLVMASIHMASLKGIGTAYNIEREGIKRDYFASRMKPLNEFAQSFSVAGTKKGVEVFLTKTL